MAGFKPMPRVYNGLNPEMMSQIGMLSTMDSRASTTTRRRISGLASRKCLVHPSPQPAAPPDGIMGLQTGDAGLRGELRLSAWLPVLHQQARLGGAWPLADMSLAGGRPSAGVGNAEVRMGDLLSLRRL